MDRNTYSSRIGKKKTVKGLTTCKKFLGVVLSIFSSFSYRLKKNDKNQKKNCMEALRPRGPITLKINLCNAPFIKMTMYTI